MKSKAWVPSLCKGQGREWMDQQEAGTTRAGNEAMCLLATIPPPPLPQGFASTLLKQLKTERSGQNLGLLNCELKLQ